MVSLKDELHELVDGLTDAEADYYYHTIKARKDDPLWTALMNAPLDDEPVTEEEEALVEEARQEWRHGEGRSLEEVWADIERGRRQSA